MSIKDLFTRKPRQTEVTLGGSLKIGKEYPNLPIKLELLLDKGLTEVIQNSLFSTTQTMGFPCRGANGKCDEVTAIITQTIPIRGENYKEISCPRYKKNFLYNMGLLNAEEREYSSEKCYCGKDPTDLPVVREEAFAENKFFECPYK